MKPLVVGSPCEVKKVVMWTRHSVQYRWTPGFVVVEVAPVIGGKPHTELVRLREVARGHVINMPASYVRPMDTGGVVWEDA